jgi:hypothetical protein
MPVSFACIGLSSNMLSALSCANALLIHAVPCAARFPHRPDSSNLHELLASA